jgi:glycosyltransferase A (GT-A) superfamily protein (DUF2064 family)
MNENALVIIAKYPEEGNVKTRLKGFITEGKRIERDIVDQYSTCGELKEVSHSF